MSKIRELAIGEVADVFDGPHATPKKTEEGPIYLGIDAISERGALLPSEFAHLSEADFINWTKRVTPKPDDIVFSYEATLGRYALIPEGFRGCLGRRLGIVRVKSPDVNPRWLYYYFQTPSWTKFVSNHTFHGSTVDRISVEEWPTYKVPFPDKSTQDRQVAILSAIDDKIENNRRLMNELEATARLVYDEWFVRFDFPDEHGRPYRSSGGKMVWNDELKREIPEGWKLATVGNLLSVTKGISYTSTDLEGNGIPMVNLASFSTDGMIKLDGMKTFSGSLDSRRLVMPGNLLMCVTQQTSIDLTGKTNVIGKTFLMPPVYKGNVIISTDVAKLDALCPELLPFLDQLFRLPDIHKHIVGYANGTKIKHLDVEGALNFRAAMPADNSLLQRFAMLSDSAVNRTGDALREIRQLQHLRNWLLPVLMNGQVKIG